jgi:hypothetical protein
LSAEKEVFMQPGLLFFCPGNYPNNECYNPKHKNKSPPHAGLKNGTYGFTAAKERDGGQ